MKAACSSHVSLGIGHGVATDNTAHNLFSLLHSPSGSTGDGGLPVSVIIAGILGPVVIGLMLMVGVVVACLVWRRERARKSQSSSTQQHVETIGSNPVCEGTGHNLLLRCIAPWLAFYLHILKVFGEHSLLHIRTEDLHGMC